MDDNYATMLDMGYSEGFDVWLQQELDLRNWNRSELARRAKVSKQTVASILSTSRAPGPEVCDKFAQALKIPVKIVMIKAGLLPAEKGRGPLLDEIEYKAECLSVEKRQLVVDFINGLLIREQSESRQSEKGGK